MATAEHSSQIARAVDRNTNTLLRRAPTWSIGIGFVLFIILAGVWVMKDSLVAITANSERIRSMESEIAHCKEMRVEMERQIAYLREENAGLKQRVSSLEQVAARTKMP